MLPIKRPLRKVNDGYAVLLYPLVNGSFLNAFPREFVR